MTPTARVRFEIVDPQTDRAVASLTAYFEELDERFATGFQPEDTLVADAPKFRPPGGALVIATVHDQVIARRLLVTLSVKSVGQVSPRSTISPGAMSPLASSSAASRI
jgi:hypothetical protein